MSLACHKAQSFLPLDAETIYQACTLVPQVGRPAAQTDTAKTGTSPRGSIHNLVSYVLCISTAPTMSAARFARVNRSSDAAALSLTGTLHSTGMAQEDL